MTLEEFLKDKKIVILGYGKQGKSTYKYIRKHFLDKSITIADRNENIDRTGLDENTYFKLGKDYLKNIGEFDIIIKSPGVMLKDEDVSNFKDKIITDYDLLMKFTNGVKIGITGTKGKSTTSTVLYEALKRNGKKAFLLGNIGNPILDEIDNITEDSFVVIEVSSHTLEFAKSSPNIAILLNIYPEHLDYYKSMDDYINAKFNIAKFQSLENYFIYNGENEFIKKYNFEYKSNDIAVFKDSNGEANNKVYLENSGIYLNMGKNNPKFLMDKNEERNIKGEHILNNMLFVLAISEILNLDLNLTIKAIKETKPLEHRLEYVGKYNDIDFFDDAIATIPESTINSIKTLGKVDTLICGGMDRGVNQKGLIEFLKNSSLKNIICMPETGDLIYDNLKGFKNVIKVKDMEEAVAIAKTLTLKGETCLLSPAASSYNRFKNFEEKGNLFKKLVKDNII